MESVAPLRPILVTLAVTLSGICASCKKPGPPTTAPPQAPPEVEVARPLVREVAEWDEYTGRLAAVDTVEVRARVGGFLDKVHFRAGQIVKADDVLFTIDPRPFQAELERAEAAVLGAEAVVNDAAAKFARQEDLRTREIAAEDEYRDALYADRKAKADLELARAERRLAELNLDWTSVKAPISGRIGRELVDVGNLVSGGSIGATLLTTIVSLDPIHCYFDADEKAFLKYSRMNLSGERPSSRDTANPVCVALFDETEFSHTGKMDFVDNSLDLQTGTMRGRALLDNPTGLLTPGMFVRLRLLGAAARPTVFVPDAAIGADQVNRVVFVVDDQNKISVRRVELGPLQDGLRIIRAGLDGSERIVVSGVQRARPGAPVTPIETDIAGPGASGQPERKSSAAVAP